MTTQLFALGLPAIISVSVAGADQPFTPSTSGRSGRYVHMHIALDFGRPRKHALLVAFSKPVRDAPELDCQYACLLLQPPSASQQRLAKRRGWTKIQTDTLEGHSNPGVTCYWIRKEGKADRVILLARPDTANFMGRQPDDSSIAELALPGTHDTCAFYGYPISQCQQPATTLAKQLLDGVRYLDIRCQVVKGELHVYHGARDQRSTFPQVLRDLVDFLTSHPTESVIMSVKDEVRTDGFSRLVWLDMAKYQDMWFLENRVPTLGEVRGKAILLTRFWANPDDDNWEDGRGWRVPGWGPPTRGLSFEMGGMRARLQDWYTLASFLQIPEKLAIITDSLAPQATKTDSDQPTLVISFASASGFPLSPPNVIAKGFGWPAWHMGVEGINSRLEGWLVQQLAARKRITGIVPLDFYRQSGVNGEDGGLRELLVLMNEIS